MNNERLLAIAARFHSRTDAVQHDGSIGEIRITPREFTDVLADAFLMGAESVSIQAVGDTENQSPTLSAPAKSGPAQTVSDTWICHCWRGINVGSLPKLYAVRDSLYDDNDESSEAWTISPDPDESGWETDCGTYGYGLPRSIAEAIVERCNASAESVLDALSESERLEVMSRYCSFCGAKDSACPCMNDE